MLDIKDIVQIKFFREIAYFVETKFVREFVDDVMASVWWSYSAASSCLEF